MEMSYEVWEDNFECVLILPDGGDKLACRTDTGENIVKSLGDDICIVGGDQEMAECEDDYHSFAVPWKNLKSTLN